ncbi:MAG: hypothetical protein WC412_05550 [Candidatus Omnitrophota bacterium]|jgi:hypothetical protein
MHQNFLDTYFPIVFIFLVFLFIYGVSSFSGKRKFKKLSTSLNGQISKFSLWPIFKGQYQGLNFSISLLPAGKGTPPYLVISILKTSSLALRMYKESMFAGLGKKLGIVHEVKINDELFDREFLIFSNNHTQAVNYLNNSAIKETIRGFFDDGFIELVISKKSLFIRKPNYSVDRDLSYQNISTLLQKLNLLARGLYGE